MKAGPSATARTGSYWRLTIGVSGGKMAHTILVVDDEAGVIRLVELNLTQEGYQVRTASNGEEALASIAQQRPDLVVMDVMMPKLDGFETLKRLKADPSTADIPIIMLTARAQDEDVFEGYGTGAQWYLTKPFNPEELRRVVRHLLEQGRGEGTDPPS
jgi:DNA-binding response OmpR family regulator